MDENKISKIKDFTDLKTWQEGHFLVIEIYKITKCEKFVIPAQAGIQVFV
jgi:hypothetical protein